jgi:integrase/recombinase XerD
MQTSITLSLDKRRPKKDGTCPIIFRISREERTTSIGSGYYVDPKFWDEDKKKIRNAYKGYPNIITVNNDLTRALQEKKDAIQKLDDQGELPGLSVLDLRAKLEKNRSSVSLTDYTKDLVEQLEKKKRFGTGRAYKSMMQAVEKHLCSENVLFNRITLPFLREFETTYIARGNSYNGLSAILRSLRAVMNLAIEDGIIERESSPFSKYKIINMPTAKRAIDSEAIAKIINLELDESHPCFETRNVFLLSYYNWGMNLIDLCYLKVGNIVDGRIKYQRSKTHKQFDIKVLPVIEPILDHYAKGKSKDQYLLPVIKREADRDKDRDIQWYRKRYNKKLRMIANMCGIDAHLTSYVSRHSFASHAESIEIPLQVISRMLGHTKLSTTQIYLAGFGSDAIDAYHDRVFQK